MNRVARFSLPALLVVLVAASPALVWAKTHDLKLKEGVQCQQEPEDAYEGETHRCYFSPSRFGKRDFTTRNGRATYVVTTLGPDCDEIEILGDANAPLTLPGGGEIKQVSVRCIH